jgi:hypothetical protein
MEFLNDMALFVEVVKAKGFRGASEATGVPNSTVSRRIGALEKAIGLRLLHRTTRKVELTEAGQIYFERCKRIVDEARLAHEQLGEHKSLQTDRVVLMPGPEEELHLVRYIYSEFLDGGKVEREIADVLNAKGVRTDRDRYWTRGTVHQVLTNEKYIGNNVYNRTSFKLKLRHVRNSPDMWVRCDGAFEPVVPEDWFKRVQAIIAARAKRFDDAMLLDLLGGLYKRVGVLSGLLIDEQEGMPSSSTYRTRFGGLARAYELVGFVPRRDYRYLEINRALRARMPALLNEITDGFS